MSSIMIPSTPSSTASASLAASPNDSASSAYSGSPRPSSGGSPSSTRTESKSRSFHDRRPSLISIALSKQECTVIDVGPPDGPTRLVSYAASGQGFVWNPEIFLPSYLDCEYIPLEHRRDPVHDILLSDEEVKNMFPQ